MANLSQEIRNEMLATPGGSGIFANRVSTNAIADTAGLSQTSCYRRGGYNKKFKSLLPFNRRDPDAIKHYVSRLPTMIGNAFKAPWAPFDGH